MAKPKNSRPRKKRPATEQHSSKPTPNQPRKNYSDKPQRPSLVDRLTGFVEGDTSKQKQREGYFARPIAPSPMWALLFVTVLCAALLVVVSDAFSNDYAAAFGCFLVLVPGAAILDITGRSEAHMHPNPTYKPNGLPNGSRRLKVFLILVTLSVVIGAVGASVEPGEPGPRLPYFYGVGFVFLVMPQLLARLEMRKQRPQAPEPAKKDEPEEDVSRGEGGATFYR